LIARPQRLASSLRLGGKQACRHTKHCSSGSGDPADVVPGIVFLLTQEEIEATDLYETDAYARVAIELVSGTTAFVYVGPDAAACGAGPEP
jgi:hypothetical protein